MLDQIILTAVLCLLKQLKCSVKYIHGSEKQRYQVHSQIFLLSAKYGTLSAWIVQEIIYTFTVVLFFSAACMVICMRMGSFLGRWIIIAFMLLNAHYMICNINIKSWQWLSLEKQPSTRNLSFYTQSKINIVSVLEASLWKEKRKKTMPTFECKWFFLVLWDHNIAAKKIHIYLCISCV